MLFVERMNATMRLAHCWPTPRMNVTCSPRFRKGGAPGWACGCSSTLSPSCAGTAAAQPRYPIDHEKNTQAGRVTATPGPGKATSGPEEGLCVLVGDKHLGRHLYGDEAVIAVIEALECNDGTTRPHVLKRRVPLAVFAAVTDDGRGGVKRTFTAADVVRQHGLDLRCFGFRRDQFRHMLAGQRSKNPVFDSGR